MAWGAFAPGVRITARRAAHGCVVRAAGVVPVTGSGDAQALDGPGTGRRQRRGCGPPQHATNQPPPFPRPPAFHGASSCFCRCRLPRSPDGISRGNQGHACRRALPPATRGTSLSVRRACRPPALRPGMSAPLGAPSSRDGPRSAAAASITPARSRARPQARPLPRRISQVESARRRGACWRTPAASELRGKTPTAGVTGLICDRQGGWICENGAGDDAACEVHIELDEG